MLGWIKRYCILTGFVCLLVMPIDASALSCGKRPTIKEAFAAADLVFTGEIIGVEDSAYKFKISEAFKDNLLKNKNRKEVLIANDSHLGTGAEKVYKGNTFIMYTRINNNEYINRKKELFLYSECGRSKVIPEQQVEREKIMEKSGDYDQSLSMIIFTGKLIDKQLIKETKAGKSYTVTMEIDEIIKQPSTKISHGQAIEMGFYNPSDDLDKNRKFLVVADQHWKRVGDPRERKNIIAYGINTNNTIPMDEVEKLRKLSKITADKEKK